MIRDVEHLFMCLLAICMSFLKKMSIQILCPFLNLVVCFYVVSVVVKLYEFSIYFGY